MNDNFQKEYEDFLHEENAVFPSLKTSTRALNFIKEDLQPAHALVMAKLVFLQLFIGLLTMLFCPQFDLSLTNNHQLFHILHRAFGEEICLALCGGIFMGSASLVAAYVLKESEILLVQKNKFLHIFFLSGFCVAGFLLFGAEVYLDLIPLWIIGGVGFGAALLNINFKIKKTLA